VSSISISRVAKSRFVKETSGPLDRGQSWTIGSRGHIARDQHCADSQVRKSEIGEVKTHEVRVLEGEI
jgi:hypothetical protein